MKNPWFRLYAEFATDPKVQSMSETFQRRLIMLFCMRCSGDLQGLGDDELACALRISPSELAKTKASFIRKGFVSEDWEIIHWNERQFISDDITQRVRRHREKVKRFRNVSETFLKRPCNGNETPPDTDTDTDTEDTKNLSASSDAAGAENGFYLTRKKRKLTGKRWETFLRFWDAFDYRKGKAEAADAWMDIPQLTESLVAQIVEAARYEAVNRQQVIASGRTPKMAQGWLSGRRWEDDRSCGKTWMDTYQDNGVWNETR